MADPLVVGGFLVLAAPSEPPAFSKRFAMRQITDSALQPTPVRASTTDDPTDLLSFAVDAFRKGRVALATLVEVRGGAARALGSQIAVTSDGRFCGYVSGGCVEAAVAAEALLAIAEGRDRLAKFGEGSPFFDIVLPCGGGISVAIHVVRDPQPLCRVLDRLGDREAVGLRYSPQQQSLWPTPSDLAPWMSRFR